MSDIIDNSVITLNSSAFTYCPIVLTFEGELGRKWKLIVQQTPEPKIICEGDEPTRGEMAELLCSLRWEGKSLLDTFMILAKLHRVEPNA